MLLEKNILLKKPTGLLNHGWWSEILPLQFEYSTHNYHSKLIAFDPRVMMSSLFASLSPLPPSTSLRFHRMAFFQLSSFLSPSLHLLINLVAAPFAASSSNDIAQNTHPTPPASCTLNSCASPCFTCGKSPSAYSPTGYGSKLYRHFPQIPTSPQTYRPISPTPQALVQPLPLLVRGPCHQPQRLR